MFFFGLIKNGPRGQEAYARWNRNEPMEFEPVHDDIALDQIGQYGIEPVEERGAEWDAHDDSDEDDDINPFALPPSVSEPPRLSYVLCEAPGCPFNADQVELLFSSLHNAMGPLMRSSDMEVRTTIWIKALEICRYIWESSNVQ